MDKITLAKLVESEYPDVPMVGVYEGPGTTIYPDYTDEYLETHGDRIVKNYYYSTAKNVLVVELEEE